MAPAMLAFNQRVCLRRRIDPLSNAEVQEYLRFKLHLAGADPDRVLGADVAGLLFEYSGGIIRVIDNLLEAALSHAAAAGDKTLTGAHVAEMAEQRFGLVRMTPAAVDELLAAGSGAEDADEAAEPAPIDDDEIPTLTEIVIPGPHSLGRGRDTGRAAGR